MPPAIDESNGSHNRAASPSQNVKAIMSFSLSVARLTLIEALRTRLPWLAAIVVALALGLAQFLGQVAIIEAAHIQATLLATLLRVTAVFIVVTFVVTSMVRETSDKVTELLLSQPAPRSAYFFGKLAGYFAVAGLIAISFAIPLAFFSSPGGLLLWTLSLLCELTIMAALSLFCVLSLTQVVPAISAAAGFYLLARSMTTIQLIAAASLSHDPTLTDRIVSWGIAAVAMLLPSLDLMTPSSWLLSMPDPSALTVVLVQTALYLPLLASASLFDLYRKNF